MERKSKYPQNPPEGGGGRGDLNHSTKQLTIHSFVYICFQQKCVFEPKASGCGWINVKFPWKSTSQNNPSVPGCLLFSKESKMEENTFLKSYILVSQFPSKYSQTKLQCVYCFQGDQLFTSCFLSLVPTCSSSICPFRTASPWQPLSSSWLSPSSFLSSE